MSSMFFWRKARPPTPLPGFLRKVKVCCTIGPSCETPETIQQMVTEGMNLARFNLSHENAAAHKKAIGTVRSVTAAYSRTNPVGVFVDTRGKEIRTTSRDNPLDLEEGARVRLRSSFQSGGSSSSTSNRAASSSASSSDDLPLIHLQYPNIHELLQPGHSIRMQDGEVQLTVESVDAADQSILCNVLFDAKLGPDPKNVHLPHEIALPSTEILKKEDAKDLEQLAPLADGVLLSFTETPEEVDLVRRKFPGLEIVSKIESVKGLKNLDDIIDVSDGVMVARGDLGMAIEEALHSVQKYIIKKCNDVGCPVWVATQMLESMKTSKKPTVAELSDISNAVLDGADTLMLSAETARGDYPVDAVSTMSKTAFDAQRQMELAASVKLRQEVQSNYQKTHRRLFKGIIKPRLQRDELEENNGATDAVYFENKHLLKELQRKTTMDQYEKIGDPLPGMDVGGQDNSTDALIEEIIVRNATQIANDANCKLILAITESGLTASLLAKYRPSAVVLMLTDSKETQKKFLQVRGVRPVLIENCGKLGEQLLSYYDGQNRDSLEYVRQNTTNMIDAFEQEGMKFAKEANLVQKDDKVLLLRSMPAGYDQMLKILQV
ncbi:unnamed protein product [Amoebophrya sp. A120]|nr:unnamed protein product [Amoebophrya sp. A120]|eukprot:GSA120T00005726001.1